MQSSYLKKKYRSFISLEDEYGLYDIRVHGIPVWERIRKSVFDSLIFSEGDTGEEPDDGENGEGLLTYLLEAGYKDLTVRNPLVAPHHDIIFVNGRRERLEDGVWWNIYCDPVCEELSHDCLHLDPSEYYRKTPLKTESVYPTRPLELLAGVRNKLRPIDVDLPTDVYEQLRDVEAAIEAEFNQTVRVVDRVHSSLEARERMLPLFERTLNRMDPALAITIPNWGTHRKVFIEACQNRNVPVVEIQHGSPNEYHLGYSYPNGPSEVFPDYLFTWGEFWTDQIEYPLPAEQIFEVGFPHFEQKRASYPTTDRADSIVVISQPRIGEEISKFAASLGKDSNIDCQVIYKLHPAEYGTWQSRYPWLADAGVRVVGNHGLHLYELFAEARAQVGVYSTAVYEGLTYDLQTFLVDVAGVGYMNRLIELGAVDVVSDPSAVATRLGTTDTDGINTERLFKSNALERMRTQIERLIE